MKKELLLFMKRNILTGLYQIGRFAGLNKGSVSILCYHGISEKSERHSLKKEVFEEHIKKISEHSKIISLEEAVGILDGVKVKGSAVVLTFDDGFANLMDIAPLVEKYSIKPAVFVLSDPEHANKAELGNQDRLMTVEEIKILHEKGWTIGCHSATHAAFSILSQEEAKKQIIGAKSNLESSLGFAVDFFAYPKGIFNKEIINVVKNGGYRAAFSILPGVINLKANRWILPRTVIDNSHHINEFPSVYSPTNYFIRKIANRFDIWGKLFNN